MPPDKHGPPADLDTSARHLYRQLREELKIERRWKNVYKHALGETCRFWQRARDARAACVDEDGKPALTVLGSKDQIVVHPNLATAERAEKSFMEGLRELGFTPAAVKRLEISPPKATGGKFGL